MATASAGNGGACGRLAACDAVEFGVEGVERRHACVGRRVAFVGQVVGGARKAIDRDDRGPQPRRHEDRRDGKIFVMADGHAKEANQFQKGKLARRAGTRPRGIRDSEGRFALYLPVRRKRLPGVIEPA